MKARWHLPEAGEVKRFSSQFTSWDWHILCSHTNFMSALLMSLPKAAFHASVILKRPVYFYAPKTSADRLSNLYEESGKLFSKKK
jgi:hypothetical protein